MEYSEIQINSVLSLKFSLFKAGREGLKLNVKMPSFNSSFLLILLTVATGGFP